MKKRDIAQPTDGRALRPAISQLSKRMVTSASQYSIRMELWPDLTLLRDD